MVFHSMKALLETLKPGDQDWELATSLDPARLPAHIAIIMDGNGRWANRRHLPRVAGHQAGVAPVRSTVETCARLGIQDLTLYAFSCENWKRPRDRGGYALVPAALLPAEGTAGTAQERHPACAPSAALTPCRRMFARNCCPLSRKPAANTGLRVNLAINYGGRAEMVDAVNALLDAARSTGDLDALAGRRAGHRRAPLHRRIAGSGPADPHLRARCASATSCSGRSRTRSCTLPPRSGRTSAAPTCWRPSWTTRSATAAMAGWAGRSTGSRRRRPPSRPDVSIETLPSP